MWSIPSWSCAMCHAGKLFERFREIGSSVATYLVTGYLSQSRFVNFTSINACKSRKSRIHRPLSQPAKSAFCSHFNCSSNRGALTLFNDFCLFWPNFVSWYFGSNFYQKANIKIYVGLLLDWASVLALNEYSFLVKSAINRARIRIEILECFTSLRKNYSAGNIFEICVKQENLARWVRLIFLTSTAIAFLHHKYTWMFPFRLD